MGKRPWVLVQLEPFIYTQEIPMEQVTIVHGKGKPWPTTTLIELETGQPFEALVEMVDENSIVVKLNQAVSFTAYIY